MKKFRIAILGLIIMTYISCVQQLREVTILFEVDMTEINDVSEVGIIGEYQPMSWDVPTLLTDTDGDGTYTGEITIMAAYNYAEFKFVLNQDIIELEGRGNRIVRFTDVERTSYKGQFDVPDKE